MDFSVHIYPQAFLAMASNTGVYWIPLLSDPDLAQHTNSSLAAQSYTDLDLFQCLLQSHHPQLNVNLHAENILIIILSALTQHI